MKRPNPIKGGVGDRLSFSDVAVDQLVAGIEHEMEHSDDVWVAADIAIDHLSEDPLYYAHLQQVEDGQVRENRLPAFVDFQEESLEEDITSDVATDQKYVIGPNEKLKSYLTRVGADKIKTEKTDHLYHIVLSRKFKTKEPPARVTLQPKIPRSAMSGEDRTVPRVCFVLEPALDKAIEMCLKAIEVSVHDHSGDVFAVYRPVTPIDVLVPAVDENGHSSTDRDDEVDPPNLFRVPDSMQTGEVWSLRPVECVLVDTVEIQNWDIDDPKTDYSRIPWKRKTEAPDPLLMMRQLLGSLSDEHPGEHGKDLSIYEMFPVNRSPEPTDLSGEVEEDRVPAFIEEHSLEEDFKEDVPVHDGLKIHPGENLDSFFTRIDFRAATDRIEKTQWCFHIVNSKKLNGTPESLTLKPKIPIQPMPGEDNHIPRVCFVNDGGHFHAIEKAMDAIAAIATPGLYCVYKPKQVIDIFLPYTESVEDVDLLDKEELEWYENRRLNPHTFLVVPDAKQTSEVWSLKPTECEIVYTINIGENVEKDFERGKGLWSIQKDFTRKNKQAVSEDAQSDLGVKLKVEDNDDEVSFWLLSKGQKKGVVTVVEDSHVPGYWEVYNADFDLDKSGQFKGKGLGMVIYPKINDWLKRNKNAKLASDVSRSQAAERLWQKLVASGKASKKKLGISKAVDDVYVFNESLLSEDSRGNIKNILKIRDAGLLNHLHEKFGKQAFLIAIVFLKYLAYKGNYKSNYEEITKYFDDRELVGLFFEMFEQYTSKFVKALSMSPRIADDVKDPSVGFQELWKTVRSKELGISNLLARAKKDGIVYDDGFFWLKLDWDECSLEGDLMGHCGEDPRGTMWSLRDKQGAPHVTLTFNEPKKTIHQVKGKQNRTPDKKYWRYVEDFVKKKNAKAIEVVDEFGDDPMMDDFGAYLEKAAGIRSEGFDVFEGSRWSLVELLADRGLRINVKEYKEDGDPTIEVMLLDGYGKQRGELKAYYDDRMDAYAITYAQNDEPGKGIGEEMYKEVDDWLKRRKGKRLASGFFREPGAEGLWQKLVRQGVAKSKTVKIKGTGGHDLGNKQFYVFESSAWDLTEDVVSDLDVRLKFREKEDSDTKYLNVTIWSDYEEEVIGFVKTYHDEKNKLFRIESAHLNKGYVGKGIGSWVYRQINDYVKKTYSCKLASDTERSPEAEGLWKKLSSAGLAKKMSHEVYKSGYYVFV